MNTMIQLKDAFFGKPTLVSMNKITHVYRDSENEVTVIALSNKAEVYVKEKPKQILEIIEKNNSKKNSNPLLPFLAPMLFDFMSTAILALKKSSDNIRDQNPDTNPNSENQAASHE
jgi:hypothetical protein